MPSVSKNGPCFFLGLELATDQLRASIVDESLELVGVECVDFDSELSEYQSVFFLHFLVFGFCCFHFTLSRFGCSVYGCVVIFLVSILPLLSFRAFHRVTDVFPFTTSRTQGGIFTTPGDAHTTPVDMWVKALGTSLLPFPPQP